MTTVDALFADLDTYRRARRGILHQLGLDGSQRDPLAEFAEHLVAALMGGTLATSRVQARWDVELDDGQRVQVKYLANPAGSWVNEHTVRSVDGVAWYALVLYRDFRVEGVMAFPADLTGIGSRLGKRHPEQHVSLQLTKKNWLAICDTPEEFTRLGMRVWLPPFSEATRTSSQLE